MHVFQKSKAVEAAKTMEINLDLFTLIDSRKNTLFIFKKKGKFVVDEAFKLNHVHIL